MASLQQAFTRKSPLVLAEYAYEKLPATTDASSRQLVLE